MANTKKAKTAEKTVESTIEAGKEQFEQAYQAGAKTATKNFEQTVNLARKQIDDAVKGFDEVANFSKGNVDAVVASGTAAVKGLETLNGELLAFSKKAVEDSIAAFKTLSGAKNLNEFFETQANLAKTNYDQLVSETGRITELALTMANDVAEPVNARIAVAAEKINRSAA